MTSNSVTTLPPTHNSGGSINVNDHNVQSGTAVGNNDSNQPQQQSALIDQGVGVTLYFPPLALVDPTPHLTALRDESSSYAQVANACMHLNAFAGTGSSSCIVDTHTVALSDLFHDNSYAKYISSCFDALLECLAGHQDRRCRILASHTLALLARSAYARLRPSPLLYSQREPVPLQLEDEVGTDVPAALAAAALDEPDNGVSSKALQALAILTLSTNALPGAVDEDELQRATMMIAFAHTSPFAPTLKAVVDEDPSVALAELQARILDHVLDPPRVGQILERVRRYTNTSQQAAALPIITASILHQLSSNTIITNALCMDRLTYAKRWSDVDTMGQWVRILAETLLLPLLQQSRDMQAALCAATCAVRLLARVSRCLHTKTAPSWMNNVAMATVSVLRATVGANNNSNNSAVNGFSRQLPLQDHMVYITAWLVALRGIPLLPNRVQPLINTVDVIAALPTTTSVPIGVCSAAVSIGGMGRRPARIGFWTQVALHLFLDGPVHQHSVQNNKSTSTSHSNKNTNLEDKEHHPRLEALQLFLQSAPVVKLLSSSSSSSSSIISTPREEFALCMLSVAMAAGRRLRIGPDGGLQVVAISHAVMYEWAAMTRALLTALCNCCCRGSSSKDVGGSSFGKLVVTNNFLDEDLSLTVAMQTAYVKLLQEYLHFVGLLLPASSVALKLTANACPPHLLWDQLVESAAFLSSFEMDDLDENESTSKLMELLVNYELKYGIPSHQMRIFLLALAADQWGQGRICAIRQQFESPSTPNPTPQELNATGGRDICLALSPKRILAKIFESHMPLTAVDADGNKKRKDPIKKLAHETVRVCVACIENIALIACDWRRRFGSSQECKHLVSVAVGTLQGKIDETPVDDNMKALITPICEAAIGRIQLFYESDSGDPESFPVSEIITQPVRTKIKPLISNSKSHPQSEDSYLKGYLMQLSRQIIASNIEEAVLSSPIADPLMSPAKPQNYYRLNVPQIVESKDARCFGHRGEILSAWGKSVITASTPSDACAIVLAYTPRKSLRYDGEEKFYLSVLMKVFNMTAVDILEGLKLELRVSQTTSNSNLSTYRYSSVDNENDKSSQPSFDSSVVDSLGGDQYELEKFVTMASTSAIYRQELKAGEYLTWEVGLSSRDFNCNITLWPTIVYRNIPVEPFELGAKWVGDTNNAAEGEASTITGGESKSGEDDFQVTSTNTGNNLGNDREGKITENVPFAGNPLVVSPLACLQPCPLVFFCNSYGDINSFRFLWFRAQYHLPSINLKFKVDTTYDTTIRDSMAEKIAQMSILTWAGEAVPGGYASQAWAFTSLGGQQRYVLAVLAELETNSTASANSGRTEVPHLQESMTLSICGDDKYLLYCLVGSHESREAFITALVPNMTQAYK